MTFMQNWLQYVQNHEAQSHFKKADSSHGINQYRLNNTVESTVRQMNENRNGHPNQMLNEQMRDESQG